MLKSVSNAAQPIAPRLVSLWYCEKTRIASGGFLGRPQFAITLTRDGVAKANHPENIEAHYSGHIRANQIEHDLSVQRVTLKLLQAGVITDYTPARLLEGRAAKIPDALLLFGDFKIALEIENEEKTRTKFDLFSTRLINFLQESENHLVMILSDRSGVLRNYAAKLKAGEIVNLVKADGKGAIQKNYTRQYTVESAIADRILISRLTPEKKILIHGMRGIIDDDFIDCGAFEQMAKPSNDPLDDEQLENLAQKIAARLQKEEGVISEIDQALITFFQSDDPWQSYTPEDFNHLPPAQTRPGRAFRARYQLESLTRLTPSQEALVLWRTASILWHKREDRQKDLENIKTRLLLALL